MRRIYEIPDIGRTALIPIADQRRHRAFPNQQIAEYNRTSNLFVRTDGKQASR
jgi:hypothetical protein